MTTTKPGAARGAASVTALALLAGGLAACSGSSVPSSPVLPTARSSAEATGQAKAYINSVDSRVVIVNGRFAELGNAMRAVQSSRWSDEDLILVARSSRPFAQGLHADLRGVPVPPTLLPDRDRLVRAADEFAAVVGRASAPVDDSGGLYRRAFGAG